MCGSKRNVNRRKSVYKNESYMHNHFQLNSASRPQSHLDAFRFPFPREQGRREPPPVHEEKERKKK